jgi:HlyD family secretion protein
MSSRNRRTTAGLYNLGRELNHRLILFTARLILLQQPSGSVLFARVKHWVAIIFWLLIGTACHSPDSKKKDHPVSGTIEVDEARVASRYGGRVEEILAVEGDQLKPGQVFIRLNATELKARYDQAAAQLAEWKAGARKEELQAAKNDWEALAAELEYARVEARRNAELFRQRAVSALERDNSTMRANALEKQVAASKSRYELLLAGTRIERIQQSEAQLEEIKTQIKEMDISSPTNAVLEVLSVKVGDVPGPNREVATLILTGHLWVRVYVAETWLGHIKLHEKVKVRVDSFPDHDFAGEVEQIARAAEFTPRNVQTTGERVKQVFGIKVRLPSDQDLLRAGMSADVYFPDIPEQFK